MDALDLASESVVRIRGSVSEASAADLPEELGCWLRGDKRAADIDWSLVHGFEGCSD